MPGSIFARPPAPGGMFGPRYGGVFGDADPLYSEMVARQAADQPGIGSRIADWYRNSTFVRPAVEGVQSALTLPGDVYSGAQPTMVPDTGQGSTSPQLADRAGELAGMLTLGAGAVPAEANALRMGARVFRGGSGFEPSGHGRYGSSKAFSVSTDPAIAAKYGDVASGSLSDTAKILEVDKDFLTDVDIRRARMQGYDAVRPKGSAESELVILNPRAVQSGGIRAYHGSPHDFDQFSMDKIGTGEGAQAYGHGLYFAQAEGTAKAYRDALAKTKFDTLTPEEEYATGLIMPALEAAFKKGGAQEAEKLLDKHIVNSRRFIESQPGAGEEATLSALEKLKANKEYYPKHHAHMYQVDIAADPEHFLDWDKKVRDMSPEMRQRVLGLPGSHEGDLGSQIYHRRVDEFGPSAATEQLREAGIPGIRYLDQGSRGGARLSWQEGLPKGWTYYKDSKGGVGIKDDKGLIHTDAHSSEAVAHEHIFGSKPTSNFVVFDDKLISVLKKYGLPITAAGAATLAQMHPGEAQAHDHR